MRRREWIGLILLILFAWWPLTSESIAPSVLASDNCRGFIETTCCCTANCCRSISMSDLAPEGDGYRVIATGRTVERVFWSEDGDAILCDCNGGRAYCLYRPRPNS